MTYFITISLVCLISFLIILSSLNNQKESQKAKLLDTSSTETWITFVKVLLFISLAVFLFGIYTSYQYEIKQKLGSSDQQSLVGKFVDMTKNLSESYYQPSIFSDQWIKNMIGKF